MEKEQMAWQDKFILLAVLVVLLAISGFFYLKTKENRYWEKQLLLQQENIKNYNQQLAISNQSAREELENIKSGIASKAVIDTITEYTGKIKASQILIPIEPSQVGKLPDVAGLVDLEKDYYTKEHKPPYVSLSGFKQEHEEVLKALPPEPKLELESLDSL